MNKIEALSDESKPQDNLESAIEKEAHNFYLNLVKVV